MSESMWCYVGVNYLLKEYNNGRIYSNYYPYSIKQLGNFQVHDLFHFQS